MRALWSLIRDRKAAIVLCAVLAALGALLLVVPFALLYRIIEHYLRLGVEAPLDPVINWLGWALTALVLRYVLVTSSFVFSHLAAFDLLYRIRVRLVRHVGTLPMGFWSRRNSGQMLKVVQEDVEAIEGFVAHHFPDIAAGFTLPVFIIGYLAMIDWRLAIAASIPMPLILVLMYMMWTGKMTGQNRSKVMENYHKAIERMHATMIEYVEGMPVVKTFRLGAGSYKKLRDAVQNYRSIVLTWTKGISPFRAVVTTLAMSGGLFILPLALVLLRDGEVDASTVILFLLLGTGSFQGMLKAILITSRMQIITAGVRRIQGILTARPLPETKNPRRPNGSDISFSGVTFSYTQDGPPVLKNIDLELPAGSFTAVVGPSGAGKTTVVNLLTRMWDPSAGEIRIGGVPLGV